MVDGLLCCHSHLYSVFSRDLDSPPRALVFFFLSYHNSLSVTHLAQTPGVRGRRGAARPHPEQGLLQREKRRATGEGGGCLVSGRGGLEGIDF